MKITEKEEARNLRRIGMSINQITMIVGCSKASVSVWVRDIELSVSQKIGITKHGRSIASVEKRRASRLLHEQIKRRAIIDTAKADISSVSSNDLKLIGAMLYLGEGGKTKRGVCVANSDPAVIKIMMRFFREVCAVPENKFHGYIHTFDTADIEKTEKYWSKIAGIPREQFYRTYTKHSIASLHKRKTLPYGTFDLSVNDTKLFLTIMGWIEKIKELVIES